MTRAAHTAYNAEGVDNSAPAAFVQSPRLLIMLCASLLLHAIVIGLWPDAAGTPSTATATARMALHIQHQTAAQTTQTQTQQPAAESATATASAPSDNQTAAQAIAWQTTVKPRLNKPTQPRAASVTSTSTSGKTTTHSNDNSASRDATPINTPLQAHDSDELRRQLNNRLQHALIAHFDYPLIARRRGWEGVVHIGVHVEANGRLSRVRLVATSGHASLDRAALQSLGRIERLKNSAGWLNGQQIDLIFPVRYQLIDS